MILRFEVTGSNYAELESKACKELERFLGSLDSKDRHLEAHRMDMDVKPFISTHNEGVKVWEADVVVELLPDASPRLPRAAS